MACRVGLVALALLLAVAAPAMATDFIVGDSAGWTQQGYDSWVSGKTFVVGDTLTFNFDSTHSVVQVGSQSDYTSCSTSNAVKSETSSPAKYTLDKAGTYYFVCGTNIHCSGGMKMTLTAAASGSGGPAAPSTPTTPSSPSTPTPSTPSDTPTTPSTPSATPSTPKPSAAPGAVAITAATVAGILGFAAALLA